MLVLLVLLVPMRCFSPNMRCFSPTHFLISLYQFTPDLPLEEFIKICLIERSVHSPNQLLFVRLTV